ncbi:hypothetical protein [Amycolatopsis alba]|uniref:LPXTG cell wall anchor domain-containing protein n=1 Tax=Amycolatopsis alba DSM 44262 TaxID=1125972 RepID=A0A229RAQ9_AMYAL|nr:hypothetical protein [Amycolatopsis alba]OXM43753.1 hypothetical protein CFP75_37195 [Amycolatopsis alba DSM 44262]
MRIRHAVFAGVTAAALALLPATAFAAEAPVEMPEKPKGTKFWVSPKTVEAGGQVTAQGRCVTPHDFSIVAPEGVTQLSDKSVKRDGGTDVKVTYQVRSNVKSGDLLFVLLCDANERAATVKVVPAAKKPEPAKSEPVKKQVAKVPAGAPQTGGGPVDEPASAGWLIAGLAGAGVAGAGGAVLMRRRPASRS